MEHKPTFTDYLSILYKWKKFLIINLLIVTIIATTVSFLIPETYKSTAKIILAPKNSMNGLRSLLGNNSALSFGAELFGIGGSTNEDLILGLLNSRTILQKVANKFKLFEYYKEKDRNFDKLLKLMRSDLIFQPNEFGMIEVSVINKNPKLSADIANYFVELVDSMNIELAIRNAKENRKFVEERYIKNVKDLREAEDSMYAFQKKYGIFAIPEQLEISVKAAAEIEAQLSQKEILLQMLKETSGVNSPKYINLLSEVKILRNKVKELKYSDKLSSLSNVLFPFKKMPDIVIEYYRLFREVKIQSKIMEFTLPMYEQAKIEEQKSIPTILTIDKAVPSQLKYAPQKAFIILTSFFITFFVLLILIFRGEKILKMSSFHNLIEEKENKIYFFLYKVYSLKFNITNK